MGRLGEWGLPELAPVDRNARAKKLGERREDRARALVPLSSLAARYRQVSASAYADAERLARRRVEAEYVELGSQMYARLQEGFLVTDVIKASGFSAPTVYKYIDDYVRTLGGREEMVQKAVVTAPQIVHWKLGDFEENRGAIRAIRLAGPDEPWYIETRDERKGPYIFNWDDNRQLRESNKTMPDDIGNLVQDARERYAELEI